MANLLLLVPALLLALVVHDGTCLRCYHCNSEIDINCKDPLSTAPNAVKIADCSSQDSIKYNQQYLYNLLPNEVFGSVLGAPRYCHKITMGSGTVIRTCLDSNPSDIRATCTTMINSSQTKTASSQVKYCEACAHDKCNGA